VKKPTPPLFHADFLLGQVVHEAGGIVHISTLPCSALVIHAREPTLCRPMRKGAPFKCRLKSKTARTPVRAEFVLQNRLVLVVLTECDEGANLIAVGFVALHLLFDFVARIHDRGVIFLIELACDVG